MRPIKNKRKTDPRYFLHENVVERDINLSDLVQELDLEEDEEKKDNGGPKHKGDCEAAHPGVPHKRWVAKQSKQSKRTVRAKENGNGRDLLLGDNDKQLYEKIHDAIKEVFDEFLEEKKKVDTSKVHRPRGVTGRSSHPTQDVHHGAGKKGKTVHPETLPGTGGKHLTTSDTGHTRKGGVTPSEATVIAQSTYKDADTVEDINRKDFQAFNKAARSKGGSKASDPHEKDSKSNKNNKEKA